MESFEEEFKKMQRLARTEKRILTARRALETQKRAKIKPSAMNPVLLNSPLKGGDAMNVDPPLNLYWPMK
jgi:hypothetical protein